MASPRVWAAAAVGVLLSGCALASPATDCAIVKNAFSTFSQVINLECCLPPAMACSATGLTIL
jgi:hypothetical protein